MVTNVGRRGVEKGEGGEKRKGLSSYLMRFSFYDFISLLDVQGEGRKEERGG